MDTLRSRSLPVQSKMYVWEVSQSHIDVVSVVLHLLCMDELCKSFQFKSNQEFGKPWKTSAAVASGGLHRFADFEKLETWRRP